MLQSCRRNLTHHTVHILWRLIVDFDSFIAKFHPLTDLSPRLFNRICIHRFTVETDFSARILWNSLQVRLADLPLIKRIHIHVLHHTDSLRIDRRFCLCSIFPLSPRFVPCAQATGHCANIIAAAIPAAAVLLILFSSSSPPFFSPLFKFTHSLVIFFLSLPTASLFVKRK